MKEYRIRDAFNAETVYRGDDLNITREKNGYVVVVRGTDAQIESGKAEVVGMFAWPASVILTSSNMLVLEDIRGIEPAAVKSIPQVAGGNRPRSLSVRAHTQKKARE